MLSMPYYFVVMKGGWAEIVTVPPGESPNEIAKGYYVLAQSTIQAEAQQRCDDENNPIRREALLLGISKPR
jgi:hypothetical protein